MQTRWANTIKIFARILAKLYTNIHMILISLADYCSFTRDLLAWLDEAEDSNSFGFFFIWCENFKTYKIKKIRKFGHRGIL